MLEELGGQGGLLEDMERIRFSAMASRNRIPVILPKEVHEAWLSGEVGKEILTPYPAEEMTAWPISTRVNSPRNNDPAIIEKIG
jgi:putative SOS response-associated peptidase YedK